MISPRLSSARAGNKTPHCQEKNDALPIPANISSTVLIVRHHSYTRRTAYLYGLGSLALLAAVLVLSFINRYAASIPLLLFCILGFRVLVEVVVPQAERWVSGHLGEKRVFGVLSDLPDTYTA